MFRKILFVLILATSVGGFLYLKSYLNGYNEQPTFEDRLPKADFLGRCYLLDLARETSGMLFYNKIPFRDFFAQEFLLSQGKNYGLNLQKPLYFFANENGNWGMMVEVTDSSKIASGIQRLGKLLSLTDTLIYEQKTYKLEKESGYLTYDKNWLFLYKGSQYTNELKQILFAKKGGIAKCWKEFLKEKQFKDEKLVIYSNWKKLKKHGVETALFAHNSDSSSFSLLTYVRNKKKLNIKMKKTGIVWHSNEATKKQLGIHLDISELKKDTKDPIYQYLIQMGKKISFPTADFLNAWNGDLSFRQGGSTIVKESFVKSEMDDEFNVVEVKSTKDVLVPGFSLMFSVNENGPYFINRLFQKGILRKDQNKYRFITSPQLSMTKKDGYYYFYSGALPSNTENNHLNQGVWTERGTKVGFSLDSLSSNEVFGTIHIPVDRIIRRGKFF
jgi:hypothetical protein